MVEYLAPGVYVEEVPFRGRPIEGVSTSTAGFIGRAARTAAAVSITSIGEFERALGAEAAGFLALAVRGFFENGGRRCHVAPVGPGDPLEAGLDALAEAPVSMLCCPDEADFPDAAARLTAHCEARKDRLCLLQSPQPRIDDAGHEPPVASSYAAYYYPWLLVTALDGQAMVEVPAGGHVAGLYARIEQERGVHRAPTAVALLGVHGLSDELSATRSEALGSRGINVLRSFPGRGILPWNAVTTSLDPEWKYVAVRRLLLFLEASLSAGLQWAVFEPNGAALWADVRRAVEQFLGTLWRDGALVGDRPEAAFFVRCDATTMTQADLDAGRLIGLVGVAPVRPAEFVLLRITCMLASCPP